jgi:tRNA pseudouridine13 synthase
MAIKKLPGDFSVEEALRPEYLSTLTTAGPFALYRLRKDGLATPEATARLARQIGVKTNDIAYAGLKDKHARTVQHVTLKLEGEQQAPEKVGGTGVPAGHDRHGGRSYLEATRLGFAPRAISASDILHNRFRIVLRNLSREQCADMDEAVGLLTVCSTGFQPVNTGRMPVLPAAAEAKELRVVNYFGEQRFGSARHHQGFLAKHLVKGDFEGALKLAIATEARKDRMEQKVFKRTLREHWGRWRDVLPRLRRCPERKAVERLVNSGKDFRAAFCALPYLLQQLSVYAYQSYLWNETARRLIEKTCTEHGRVLVVDGDYGQMLFPETVATPPELAELNIPLLARKTELAGVWKEAAEETLKTEGVELSELHIPGVRRPFFGEEPRALFFVTEGFKLAASAPDETAGDRSRAKRLIEFSLPPGCYATVLLRALGE